MKTAFRIVAYLWILLGAMFLIVAGLTFFSALTGPSGHMHVDKAQYSQFFFLLSAMGLIFGFTAAANGRFLLLKRQRNFSMALTAVMCIATIPVGLLLGAATLYLMTRPEIRELYPASGSRPAAG